MLGTGAHAIARWGANVCARGQTMEKNAALGFINSATHHAPKHSIFSIQLYELVSFVLKKLCSFFQ
jgi:hypothetical protein